MIHIIYRGMHTLNDLIERFERRIGEDRGLVGDPAVDPTCSRKYSRALLGIRYSILAVRFLIAFS